MPRHFLPVSSWRGRGIWRIRASGWVKLLRRVALAMTVSLTLEKRVIASYLGMAPESLSRRLRALEKDGVSVAGNQVTVRDHARLVAVAQPDPLLDGPNP